MLVSSNMTPKIMIRNVGTNNFILRKNFAPHTKFYDPLAFPHAQLKNRGVEALGHRKNFLICFLFTVSIESIFGGNHMICKGLTILEKKKKKNMHYIHVRYVY